MKQRFSLVTLTGILFAMIAWGGSLYAQDAGTSSPQPQSQQSAPQAQQPSTPSQTTPPPPAGQNMPDQAAPPSQAQPPDSTQQDANDSKEFVGTIVKQGNKYVFQDSASGSTYDIDHQDEVKKFEGKKVRVRGTLDSSGKIHVQ